MKKHIIQKIVIFLILMFFSCINVKASCYYNKEITENNISQTNTYKATVCTTKDECKAVETANGTCSRHCYQIKNWLTVSYNNARIAFESAGYGDYYICSKTIENPKPQKTNCNISGINNIEYNTDTERVTKSYNVIVCESSSACESAVSAASGYSDISKLNSEETNRLRSEISSGYLCGYKITGENRNSTSKVGNCEVSSPVTIKVNSKAGRASNDMDYEATYIIKVSKNSSDCECSGGKYREHKKFRNLSANSKAAAKQAFGDIEPNMYVCAIQTDKQQITPKDKMDAVEKQKENKELTGWAAIPPNSTLLKGLNKCSGTECPSCEELLGDAINIIQKVFNYIKAFAIAAFAIFTAIDFTKTVGSDAYELKKAGKHVVIRGILVIVVFLLPTFISLILTISNLARGTCGIN